jgi:hypothetical protein
MLPNADAAKPAPTDVRKKPRRDKRSIRLLFMPSTLSLVDEDEGVMRIHAHINPLYPSDFTAASSGEPLSFRVRPKKPAGPLSDFGELSRAAELGVTTQTIPLPYLVDSI